MVDVKISGLPNAAALTGNEAIPAVQGGSNVKVLVSAIRAGMLAAGQMGLAAESIQVANNISTLNNATLSGFYRAAAGSEGNPTPTGAFLCIHMPSGGTATYGAQLGISEADGRIYQRLKTNGAWGSWIPNAFDTQVVHSTGAENIGGPKTFTAKAQFNLGAGMGIDQLMEFGGGGAVIRGNSTGTLVLSATKSSATSDLVMFLRPNGNSESLNQSALSITGAWTFGGDSAAKAASRSSLGALGLTGNETAAGDKTWNGIHTWTLASAGSVQYGTPTGLPGIIIRNGDPAGGSGALWRSDIRGGAGFCNIVVNNVAGDNTSAARGISIQQTALQPTNNNLLSLGVPSALWTQVHATNGTISTSDERLKTPLVPMTDAEEAAFLEINELPMKWQWLARIAEEGDVARWHAGPSVQAAIAVMEKHGLSAFAYSAFCYDSWPAEDEVWREWPAQDAEVVEWPAVPETWADIPAEVDEAGEIVVPARRELVHEAMPAGRVVLKEAVEAGRELIQSAVEAGDRYSFRVSELQAWILAAMARRDRREREAAELRLASIEQRLAVLESGK
ncbi:TPA: tail fiber domain-containing protein [Stenotrophomonas maltophilia]|nr:tail fiber domain-containing protein [Stenotrophomonas maltophilia]HDS1156818.1 tail fiber domain-containing protein [Stenotrophomonas maltophilia]HDS1163524.1 tail fiber domain-containing protein [Stenotrophomonas maltophilia]HDS1172277.1 tail fiber domain-containing protein [Stenotrophomonas maltophilia]HDS1176949.1 tail fiber domain-containing protein [Stenotrophomonas maltophilia]